MMIYGNNNAGADFHCGDCDEDFELKAKSGSFDGMIRDGSYKSMMSRIEADRSPNLFLLRYDRLDFRVTDFTVVPRYFLVGSTIEKLPTLQKPAIRWGWTGCSIRLDRIPLSGQVPVIGAGSIIPRQEVLSNWRRASFLRNEGNAAARGWLISIMRCIEQLEKDEFKVQEVYQFERDLGARFPSNRHIRPKIRHQLQVLRDRGYLEFVGQGRYRLCSA